METLSPTFLEFGVATAVLPGQEESGDLHIAKLFRNGALVAVVDGLGHGAEAAEAAQIAARTLEARPNDSVIALLRRCHQALQGTRGVVMSMASFNMNDETMTWVGVGNVEGVLLRANPKTNPGTEFPVLRGGVVGGQLPPLLAAVVPVSKSDTLILVTDGIESGFNHGLPLNSKPQQIADHILARHNKGTDDALVLVARYLGVSR